MEINAEVKEIYVEKARKALEESMIQAGAKWCKTIELKADGVVGEFWAH